MSNTESPSVPSSEAPISHRENRKIKDLEAQVAELKDTVANLVSLRSQDIESLKKAQGAVKSSETHTNAPRQAIYVELHNQIFLPGLGQLPKSMDTAANSQQPKLRGLKMTEGPHGVDVDLRGRIGFIPWGNIAWAVFKNLDKEAAKEADKNLSTAVAPGYAGPTKVGTATVTQK